MMSARDIASIIMRIRKAEKEMTDPDPDVMTRAMNRYDKAMQDFEKAGGYAAQSEATAMAASLGLPQEVMGQQLGTLSGGQRRRIELARILFSDADTLILDEPTNHLDADSIEWLRGYLKKYEGGFLVISHSTELLDEVVNKVWHLDAQLGQIDMYSSAGRPTCTSAWLTRNVAAANARSPKRRRNASCSKVFACTRRPPRPWPHRT